MERKHLIHLEIPTNRRFRIAALYDITPLHRLSEMKNTLRSKSDFQASHAADAGHGITGTITIIRIREVFSCDKNFTTFYANGGQGKIIRQFRIQQKMSADT